MRGLTATILDGWTLADARANGGLPATQTDPPPVKRANRRTSSDRIG
jgi:hypothetical protein